MYTGHLFRITVLITLFTITSSCKRSLPIESIPTFDFTFTSFTTYETGGHRKEKITGKKAMPTYTENGVIKFSQKSIQLQTEKELFNFSQVKVLKVFKNKDGYSYFTNEGSEFEYYDYPKPTVVMESGKNIIWFYQ
jgi:hypothetical protein